MKNRFGLFLMLLVAVGLLAGAAGVALAQSSPDTVRVYDDAAMTTPISASWSVGGFGFIRKNADFYVVVEDDSSIGATLVYTDSISVEIRAGGSVAETWADTLIVNDGGLQGDAAAFDSLWTAKVFLKDTTGTGQGRRWVRSLTSIVPIDTLYCADGDTILIFGDLNGGGEAARDTAAFYANFRLEPGFVETPSWANWIELKPVKRALGDSLYEYDFPQIVNPGDSVTLVMDGNTGLQVNCNLDSAYVIADLLGILTTTGADTVVLATFADDQGVVYINEDSTWASTGGRAGWVEQGFRLVLNPVALDSSAVDGMRFPIIAVNALDKSLRDTLGVAFVAPLSVDTKVPAFADTAGYASGVKQAVLKFDDKDLDPTSMQPTDFVFVMGATNDTLEATTGAWNATDSSYTVTFTEEFGTTGPILIVYHNNQFAEGVTDDAGNLMKAAGPDTLADRAQPRVAKTGTDAWWVETKFDDDNTNNVVEPGEFGVLIVFTEDVVDTGATSVHGILSSFALKNSSVHPTGTTIGADTLHTSAGVATLVLDATGFDGLDFDALGTTNWDGSTGTDSVLIVLGSYYESMLSAVGTDFRPWVGITQDHITDTPTAGLNQLVDESLVATGNATMDLWTRAVVGVTPGIVPGAGTFVSAPFDDDPEYHSPFYNAVDTVEVQVTFTEPMNATKAANPTLWRLLPARRTMDSLPVGSATTGFADSFGVKLSEFAHVPTIIVGGNVCTFTLRIDHTVAQELLMMPTTGEMPWVQVDTLMTTLAGSVLPEWAGGGGWTEPVQLADGVAPRLIYAATYTKTDGSPEKVSIEFTEPLAITGDGAFNNRITHYIVGATAPGQALIWPDTLMYGSRDSLNNNLDIAGNKDYDTPVDSLDEARFVTMWLRENEDGYGTLTPYVKVAAVSEGGDTYDITDPSGNVLVYRGVQALNYLQPEVVSVTTKKAPADSVKYGWIEVLFSKNMDSATLENETNWQIDIADTATTPTSAAWRQLAAANVTSATGDTSWVEFVTPDKAKIHLSSFMALGDGWNNTGSTHGVKLLSSNITDAYGVSLVAAADDTVFYSTVAATGLPAYVTDGIPPQLVSAQTWWDDTGLYGNSNGNFDRVEFKLKLEFSERQQDSTNTAAWANAGLFVVQINPVVTGFKFEDSDGDSLLVINFHGATDSLDHANHLPTFSITGLMDPAGNTLNVPSMAATDGIAPNFWAVMMDDIDRGFSAATDHRDLQLIYQHDVRGPIADSTFCVKNGDLADVWVQVDPLSGAPASIPGMITLKISGPSGAFVLAKSGFVVPTDTTGYAMASWATGNFYEGAGINVVDLLSGPVGLFTKGNQFDQGTYTARFEVVLSDGLNATSDIVTSYMLYDINAPSAAIVYKDSTNLTVGVTPTPLGMLVLNDPPSAHSAFGAVLDQDGLLRMRDNVVFMAYAPSDPDVKFFRFQYKKAGAAAWSDMDEVGPTALYKGSVDTTKYHGVPDSLFAQSTQFVKGVTATKTATSLSVSFGLDTLDTKLVLGADGVTPLGEADNAVNLRVLAYDCAGNVIITPYKTPDFWHFDNLAPIAGADLVIYDDREVLVAGDSLQGEMRYRLLASNVTGSDIEQVTFMVYADSSVGTGFVGDGGFLRAIGPDLVKPYSGYWTAPPVGNDRADQVDLVAIDILIEDVVGNSNPIGELKYLVDRHAPVARMWAINNRMFDPDTCKQVIHVPRVNALVVSAKVDTGFYSLYYDQVFGGINDDVLKVFFQTRKMPDGLWTDMESVTGYLDPVTGKVVDLFQSASGYDSLVVVTWNLAGADQTPNTADDIVGGHYLLRALSMDAEGNIDTVNTPIASVSVDDVALRAYMDTPATGDSVLSHNTQLLARTYDMSFSSGNQGVDIATNRVLFQYMYLADTEWPTEWSNVGETWSSTLDTTFCGVQFLAWTLTWNVVGQQPGYYRIRAIAKDAANNIDSNDPDYVEVYIAGRAPLMTIISPVNEQIIAPATVGWDEYGRGGVIDIKATSASWVDSVFFDFALKDIGQLTWYRIGKASARRAAALDTFKLEGWDTGLLMGDGSLANDTLWVEGYKNYWMAFDSTGCGLGATAYVDVDGDGMWEIQEWEEVGNASAYDTDPANDIHSNTIEDYPQTVYGSNAYCRDDAGVLIRAIAYTSGGPDSVYRAVNIDVLERQRPQAWFWKYLKENLVALPDSVEGPVCANYVADVLADTLKAGLAAYPGFEGFWAVARDYHEVKQVKLAYSVWAGKAWGDWVAVDSKVYPVNSAFQLPFVPDSSFAGKVQFVRAAFLAVDAAGNVSFPDTASVCTANTEIVYLQVDHSSGVYVFSDTEGNETTSPYDLLRFTDDAIDIYATRSQGIPADTLILQYITGKAAEWDSVEVDGPDLPNWQEADRVVDPADIQELTFDLTGFAGQEVELMVRLVAITVTEVGGGTTAATTYSPSFQAAPVFLADQKGPAGDKIIGTWHITTDAVVVNAVHLAAGSRLLGASNGNQSDSLIAQVSQNSDTDTPTLNRSALGIGEAGWDGFSSTTYDDTQDTLYFQFAYELVGTPGWTVIGVDTTGSEAERNMTFRWNTSALASGWYRLRFIVWDAAGDTIAAVGGSGRYNKGNGISNPDTVIAPQLYLDTTAPVANLDPALNGKPVATGVDVVATIPTSYRETPDGSVQNSDVVKVLYFYDVTHARDAAQVPVWVQFACQTVEGLTVYWEPSASSGLYDLAAIAVDLGGNIENDTNKDGVLGNAEIVKEVTINKLTGTTVAVWGLVDDNALANPVHDILDPYTKISGDELDLVYQQVSGTISSASVQVDGGTPVALTAVTKVPVTFTLYERDFPEVMDWTSVQLVGQFDFGHTTDTAGGSTEQHWETACVPMVRNAAARSWGVTLQLAAGTTGYYRFAVNEEDVSLTDCDRWVNDPRNSSTEVGPSGPFVGQQVSAVMPPSGTLFHVNLTALQLPGGVHDLTFLTNGLAPDNVELGETGVPSPGTIKVIVDRTAPNVEVRLAGLEALWGKVGPHESPSPQVMAVVTDIIAETPDGVPVEGDVVAVDSVAFFYCPNTLGVDWRLIGWDNNANNGWLLAWDAPDLDADNEDNNGNGLIDEPAEKDIEATFLLLAVAVDNGGNFGYSATVQVVVDDKVPALSIVEPKDGQIITWGTKPWLRVEGDETIKDVQFEIVGVDTYEGVYDKDTESWGYWWDTGNLPEKDQIYTVVFNASDEVANTSDDSIFVIVDDAKGPSAYITHVAGTSVYDATLAVQGTVRVRGSVTGTTALVAVEWYDGDAWIPIGTPVDSTTFTGGLIWNTAGLSGDQKLRTVAWDADGNPSTGVEVTVRVDYDLPVVVYGCDEETAPNLSYFFFSGHTQYTDSGIHDCANPGGIVINPASPTIFKVTTSPMRSDVESMYLVYRKYCDTTPFEMDWANDRAIELKLVTGPLTDDEYNNNDSDGVDEDCETGPYWKAVVADWSDYISGWSGVYEVLVKATDYAGNSNTDDPTVQRFLVTLDGTDPVLEDFFIGTNPEVSQRYAEFGETVVLNADIHDAGSDVENVAFWASLPPDTTFVKVADVVPVFMGSEETDCGHPYWRATYEFDTKFVVTLLEACVAGRNSEKDSTAAIVNTDVMFKVYFTDTAGNTGHEYPENVLHVQDNTAPVGTQVTGVYSYGTEQLLDGACRIAGYYGRNTEIRATQTDLTVCTVTFEWFDAAFKNADGNVVGKWRTIGTDTTAATGGLWSVIWNTASHLEYHADLTSYTVFSGVTSVLVRAVAEDCAGHVEGDPESACVAVKNYLGLCQTGGVTVNPAYQRDGGAITFAGTLPKPVSAKSDQFYARDDSALVVMWLYDATHYVDPSASSPAYPGYFLADTVKVEGTASTFSFTWNPKNYALGTYKALFLELPAWSGRELEAREVLWADGCVGEFEVIDTVAPTFVSDIDSILGAVCGILDEDVPDEHIFIGGQKTGHTIIARSETEYNAATEGLQLYYRMESPDGGFSGAWVQGRNAAGYGVSLTITGYGDLDHNDIDWWSGSWQTKEGGAWLNGDAQICAPAVDYKGGVNWPLTVWKTGTGWVDKEVNNTNPIFWNPAGDNSPHWTPLTIDNGLPTASVAAPDADQIERGSTVTFVAEAADAITHVVSVKLQYRLSQVADPQTDVPTDNTNTHDPDANDPWMWHDLGTDTNKPFSVTIDTDTLGLVAGAQYDFRFVATDFVCNVSDKTTSTVRKYKAVDEISKAQIVALCTMEIKPDYVVHLNGDVTIKAQVSRSVDYVEFLYAAAATPLVWNSIAVAAVVDSPGTEPDVAVEAGWNVTSLAEGLYRLAVVPTLDAGNVGNTPTDEGLLVYVDHSVAAELTSTAECWPKDGIVFGPAAGWDSYGAPKFPEFRVKFGDVSDIKTVTFQYKESAYPDLAVDDGETKTNWDDALPSENNGLGDNVFSSNLSCCTADSEVVKWLLGPFTAAHSPGQIIDFRVKVTDNACPDPNVKYIVFARNVVVDVGCPETFIAEVNGDDTPDGITIRMAEQVQMTASASDLLPNQANGGIREVEFKMQRLDQPQEVLTLDVDYTAPYTITWDALGEVRLGQYRLFADAVDMAGNSSTRCGSAHCVIVTIDPAGPPVARIVGYDIDPDIDGFDGQTEADYLYAMTTPDTLIADPGKAIKQVRFEYQVVPGGVVPGKVIRVDDGDENWIKMGVAGTSRLLPAGDPHQKAIWTMPWNTAAKANGLYKIRAVAYCVDGSYDEVGTPVFYAFIQGGALTPAVTDGFGDINLWAASAAGENTGWREGYQIAATVESERMPDILMLGEDAMVEVDAVRPGAMTLATQVSAVSRAAVSTYSGRVLAEDYLSLMEGASGHDGTLTVFASYVPRAVNGELRTHMASTNRTWFGITDAFGTNGPVSSDDGMVTVDILGRHTACDAVGYILPVYGDIPVNENLPDQRYLSQVGSAYMVKIVGVDSTLCPGLTGTCAEATVTLKYVPFEGIETDMLSAYKLDSCYDCEYYPYVWQNDDVSLLEVLPAENAVRFQINLLNPTIMEPQIQLTVLSVMSNDEGFEIEQLTFANVAETNGMLVTDDQPTLRAIIRHGDPGALSAESFSMWLDGVRIMKYGVPAVGAAGITTLPDPVSGLWCYSLKDCPDCPPDSVFEAGEHTLTLGLRDAQGRTREKTVTFYVDVDGPSAELVSQYITYGSPVVVNFRDELAGVDRRTVQLFLTGPSGRRLSVPYTLLDFEEYDGYLEARYSLPFDGLNSILLNDHADHLLAPDNWYNQILVSGIAVDLVGNSFMPGTYSSPDTTEKIGGDILIGMMVVDVVPPMISQVEPVGQPFDNDGDGLANEDGFERFDDDNDGLYDEDPVDFLVELVNTQGCRFEVVTGDVQTLYLTINDGDYEVLASQAVDNDGDGRYNEDPPNSVDNDGDGLFDEDPIDYAGAAVCNTQFPVVHANFYDPAARNGNVVTGSSLSGIDPGSLVLLLTDETRGETIDLTQASLYGDAAFVSSAEVYWAASSAMGMGQYTIKIEIADRAGNKATLPEAWSFGITGEDIAEGREVQWAAKQAMIAPTLGGGDPVGREVCIVASDVDDIRGYQVEVSYDVGYLQVVGVRAGDFLGEETSGVLWSAKGGILTVADARLADGGVGGSGVLACVTFAAVPGTSSPSTYVNLSRTKIWNGAGQMRYVGPDALEMHVRWWNAADMNYDGVVDGADLILVAMAYGSLPGDGDWNSEADLQFDGLINTMDVVAFKKQFGATTSLPGITKRAVAEGPGQFSLMLPGNAIPAQQEISAVINLTEAEDVIGANITVTYNPDVLEVVGVRSGDFLERDGKETVLAWSATQDGSLNIGLAQLGRSEGVDGAGTVGEIMFKTKATGLADLQFGLLEVGSASGEMTSASAMHVDALQVTKALPKVFALHDNYPNPFNPMTTIRYDLPNTSNTSLGVFNVVGQLVKTLVSDEQKAGEYAVKWDGRDEAGKDVGSGIYYYVFQAGDFRSVKSMVLLK